MRLFFNINTTGTNDIIEVILFLTESSKGAVSHSGSSDNVSSGLMNCCKKIDGIVTLFGE
jgi:hypothetical protein